MQGYATELTSIAEEYSAWLTTVSDARAARRPAEGGWCVKEIIGHLVDSAANNHARFVRAQATDDLVFAGYDQEAWVAAQGYADADWLALMGLWRLYNLHLARVIATVPETVRMRPRADHTLDRIAWRPVVRTETVTLDYLMADYVGHLKSHLPQIISLLGEPISGA
jgi:DinB superfamily